MYRRTQSRDTVRFTVLACATVLCACRSSNPSESRGASSSETQWIDPAKLQPGPVQHDQLTREQIERIKKLSQVFSEVDPTPPSKWIDDFKRDRDPERELRIYESMAAAYSAYCTGRNLTPEGKREVYQVVLLRSGAPDDEVLKRVQLKVLTVADAKDILALYQAPPAPVIAIPAPPHP